MNTSQKSWYLKNRKNELVRMKNWRLKNQAHQKAYGKARYRKNRKKRLIQMKALYWKNRDQNLARVKAWRLKNPGKHCDSNRVHREKTKHISPIELILNPKSFAEKRARGFETHHTGIEMDGQFVGINVPRSLNRGHCAQFGKEQNLDRVNYDAIEFLVEELHPD